MTDLINALFETGGSIFLLLDWQALRRDRKVAGVSIIARCFFIAWGLFNPYFYGIQALIYSSIAAVLVVIVNFMWLFTYIKIKVDDKKKKDKELAEAIAWDKWRDSLLDTNVDAGHMNYRRTYRDGV